MTQNSLTNTENQGQSRRHNPPKLHTLQSNNIQNKGVLAQKQTYGTMRKHRAPRNKPAHLQPINLPQWEREDIGLATNFTLIFL